MSWFSRRLKAVTGCAAGGIPTVASATNMAIPDGAYVINVSGTTEITKLLGAKSPGRIVILKAITTTGPALTDSGASATEGQMDLGGALTLGPTDVIGLLQNNNGSWVRVFSTNN